MAFPSLTCWLTLFVCLNSAQSFLVASSAVRIETLSNLIRDVVDIDDRNASIWLKNCRPKFESLKLLKSMNRPYKLLQGALGDDVRWSENQDFQHVWFVVDMKCSASVRFVLDTNKSYFSHPFRWILLFDGDDSSIYEQLHLLTDSNVILAESEGGDGRFLLRQGEF